MESQAVLGEETGLDRVDNQHGNLAVEMWRRSMEATQRLEAGPHVIDDQAVASPAV